MLLAEAVNPVCHDEEIEIPSAQLSPVLTRAVFISELVSPAAHHRVNPL